MPPVMPMSFILEDRELGTGNWERGTWHLALGTWHLALFTYNYSARYAVRLITCGIDGFEYGDVGAGRDAEAGGGGSVPGDGGFGAGEDAVEQGGNVRTVPPAYVEGDDRLLEGQLIGDDARMACVGGIGAEG